MSISYKKIAVFDFDGTLVDSPLPDTGRNEYQQKTGKPWPYEGWWGKAESLDMNIFDIPVIPSTIASYNKEESNDETLMVMMTGRMIKLSKYVEAILEAKGLKFDEYIYNMGGSTIDSKIKSLDNLLIKYQTVLEVTIFDDREEHIPSFKAWCDKQIESGRLTNFNINLVPTGRH